MKGCLTLLCWLAAPAVLLGVFGVLMGQDPIGAVLLILLAILLLITGYYIKKPTLLYGRRILGYSDIGIGIALIVVGLFMSRNGDFLFLIPFGVPSIILIFSGYILSRRQTK